MIVTFYLVSNSLFAQNIQEKSENHDGFKSNLSEADSIQSILIREVLNHIYYGYVEEPNLEQLGVQALYDFSRWAGDLKVSVKNKQISISIAEKSIFFPINALSTSNGIAKVTGRVMDLVQKSSAMPPGIKTMEYIIINSILKTLGDPFTILMKPDLYSKYLITGHEWATGIGLDVIRANPYPIVLYMYNDFFHIKNLVPEYSHIESVNNINTAQKSITELLKSFTGTEGSDVSLMLNLPSSKRFEINLNTESGKISKEDRELYFDPSLVVGIGTTSGIGIKTDVYVHIPGNRTFFPGGPQSYRKLSIPTRAIYIPGHGLKTGEKII